MTHLTLRDKGQEYVFRFLGALTLLGVGLQLFTYSPKKAFFWVLVATFILAAILLFTMMFGALRSKLTADQGMLTIRWNTRFFKKHLRIDQIREITEDKRFVRIILKEGKTVRLPVRLMESDQRKSLRRFLEENADLKIRSAGTETSSALT